MAKYIFVAGGKMFELNKVSVRVVNEVKGTEK